MSQPLDPANAGAVLAAGVGHAAYAARHFRSTIALASCRAALGSASCPALRSAT